MKKRILALLLAGLMLMSTIACGTPEPNTDEGDAQTTAAVTDSTDTELKPDLPERNYGGEEFRILTDKDSYLDVFVADMKYSDTPITKSISEDIADIYQDIKNFVCLFRLGINETMHDAVIECKEHFVQYWGQTLVNTMRALHDARYNTNEETEEEDE